MTYNNDITLNGMTRHLMTHAHTPKNNVAIFMSDANKILENCIILTFSNLVQPDVLRNNEDVPRMSVGARTSLDPLNFNKPLS